MTSILCNVKDIQNRRAGWNRLLASRSKKTNKSRFECATRIRLPMKRPAAKHGWSWRQLRPKRPNMLVDRVLRNRKLMPRSTRLWNSSATAGSHDEACELCSIQTSLCVPR